MAQHSELTQDRWAQFTLDHQILMIANEMNRASPLVSAGDIARAKNCYERVLQLTDLTVRTQIRSTLRGELLRWRDLIAELYLRDRTLPEEHRRAFRCLLRFTPEASRQIPYLGLAAAPE
jgi:hypothetical protein